MLAVIFYEMGKYPNSHNLIPFEVLILAVVSVLIHSPSFALGLARQRRATR
jgi:hypothetical protein